MILEPAVIVSVSESASDGPQAGVGVLCRRAAFAVTTCFAADQKTPCAQALIDLTAQPWPPWSDPASQRPTLPRKLKWLFILSMRKGGQHTLNRAEICRYRERTPRQVESVQNRGLLKAGTNR
jgi:hypothetical protein